MKLFCHGDDVPDRPCCSLDSINDARRVCEQLGVPHYVLNLEERVRPRRRRRLRARVRARAHADPLRALQHVHEVPRPAAQGRRDRRALDRDGALRARRRTARCCAASTRTRTSRTSSGASSAAVLARMLLPVGDSDQGRDARDGAPPRTDAHRREGREPGHLLRARRRSHEDHRGSGSASDAPSLQRGPFVLRDGRVVGEHDGHARYTIGQRRGLPGGFAEPMYVVDDPAARPRRRASGRASSCSAAASSRAS